MFRDILTHHPTHLLVIWELHLTTGYIYLPLHPRTHRHLTTTFLGCGDSINEISKGQSHKKDGIALVVLYLILMCSSEKVFCSHERWVAREIGFPGQNFSYLQSSKGHLLKVITHGRPGEGTRGRGRGRRGGHMGMSTSARSCCRCQTAGFSSWRPAVPELVTWNLSRSRCPQSDFTPPGVGVRLGSCLPRG